MTKYLKMALRNGRNIGIGVAALVAAYIARRWLVPAGLRPLLSDNIVLLAGVAAYAAAVLSSAASKTFRDGADRDMLVEGVKKGASECRLRQREIMRKLNAYNLRNAAMSAPIQEARQRVTKAMADMDAIVGSFLGGDKSSMKAQVAQKSVKMADIYLTLTDVYFTRQSQSAGPKIRALATRINDNTARLSATQDPDMQQEIQRVIDADERMIDSLRGDRRSQEKINARLQFIESTLGMLRYNIVSNLESTDILATIDSELDEADALNSALNEHYDEKRKSGRLRL